MLHAPHISRSSAAHISRHTSHLREDDHVSEVGLDALRLLALTSVTVLLGATQTLKEGIVLALETVLETKAHVGVRRMGPIGETRDDTVCILPCH